MRCAEVRETIPAFADEGEPSLATRRHFAKCPECRAELETYRSMLASLRSLEARPVDAPVGLVAKLIAIPREASRVDHVRSHVARNRAAYAGGAAAAVAVVGAAGALLWRNRERSSGRSRKTSRGWLAAA
jgi:anti-sigma factor RsiW